MIPFCVENPSTSPVTTLVIVTVALVNCVSSVSVIVRLTSIAAAAAFSV